MGQVALVIDLVALTMGLVALVTLVDLVAVAALVALMKLHQVVALAEALILSTSDGVS